MLRSLRAWRARRGQRAWDRWVKNRAWIDPEELADVRHNFESEGGRWVHMARFTPTLSRRSKRRFYI